MITAGVDLAAEAKGTALAVIEWDAAGAVLRSLTLGASDRLIVDTVLGTGDAAAAEAAETETDADAAAAASGAAAPVAHKLGIDCALGWPDEFAQFIADHHAGRALGPEVDGGMEWRRTLAYRATDRAVHARTGRWPLSVSTDRLGLTAMRAAGLLARLAERSIPIDRSGAGLVAEIYPAASLRLWGFVTTGYRVDAVRRAELIDELLAAAPWFDVRGFLPLMRSSTDAFDAVVAALATRASAIGLSDPPPDGMLDRAGREGWVALPNGSLGDLLGP